MMTEDKIIDAIFEGKDGSLTIWGSEPKYGYMVGGVSYALTVTPENFEPHIVFEFMKAHYELLSTNPNMYIGWWTHEGRIYLDIAENIRDYGLAYVWAKNRREIAFWDVARNQEVKV